MAQLHLAQEILNIIYPVGSIYMSVNSVNPSNLFGGTWEQIKGRFLLGTGVPSANSDNYFGTMSGTKYNAGPGSTGGQDFHTLTIEEMPSHNHGVDRPPYYYNEIESADDILAETTGVSKIWPGITHYTGGDNKHNNMPPYFAVYIWRRTK